MKKITHVLKQSMVLSRTSVLCVNSNKLKIFKVTPFCYVLEDYNTQGKKISITKDSFGWPQAIQSRDEKGVLKLTVIRYIPYTGEEHLNDFYECVTDVMSDYDVFKNFAVNDEGVFIQKINYNKRKQDA